MRQSRTGYLRATLGLLRLEDRETPSAVALSPTQPPKDAGTSADLRAAVGQPAVGVAATAQAAPHAASGALARTTTTLTVSPTAPAVNRPVNLTVTVHATSRATPSGTVTLMDGARALGRVGLSGGRAAFSTSGLAPGAHRLTAVYNGTAAFAGSSSSSVTVTVGSATKPPVGRAATQTSVSASPTSPVVNKPLNLTITVHPRSGSAVPSGTVTLKEGNRVLGTVTLRSGRATFSTSGLGAGVHHMTAVYNGSSSFSASTSSPMSVIIASTTPSAGRTTTRLTATPTVPAPGQRVTLTAVVTMTGGVASGRVTFKDGSVVLGTATLSGGRATLVTSALGAGAHRMSAVYSGAGRLAGSTSAPVSLTVAAPSHRAASQTTLTASASAVGSGKPVTFTATVRPVSGSGTLTGTVTFRDGTTVLGTIALSNGSARLALSTLRNGSHSVTATYNGDGRFNTSASAVRSLTVSPVLTPTTGTSMVATELTVPATPVSARRPVTLRVVVRPLNGSPVAPTGRVTFRKGSLVLGIVTLDRTGAATFTLPAGRLAPGQYMISAYYDGDSRYAGDGGADILALSA